MSHSVTAAGRGYSMATHGAESMVFNRNSFVLKQGVQNMHSYKLGYNGINLFRIYPNIQVDPATGARAWTPFRLSGNPNDYGDWIRRYPAIRGIGGQLTFLLGDPMHERNVKGKPPCVLYDAVERAVRMGQERPGWAGLTKGGSNRAALLPRASDLYLVQVGLFVRGGKSALLQNGEFPGAGPNTPGVLLELSKSAGEALLGEVDKWKDPAPAGVLPDDWENLLLNGDPISWNYGRFVTLYPTGQGDPRLAAQARSGQFAPHALLTQPQTAGNVREDIGYSCYAEPAAALPGVGVFPASAWSDPGMQAVAAAKIQAWDDILYFPTEVEQAHLIAPLFPAELILYAFGDHPDWIPEGTRQAAVRSVSAAVPAVMPGADYAYAQRGVVGQAALPSMGPGQPMPQHAPFPGGGPAMAGQQAVPDAAMSRLVGTFGGGVLGFAGVDPGSVAGSHTVVHGVPQYPAVPMGQPMMQQPMMQQPMMQQPMMQQPMMQQPMMQQPVPQQPMMQQVVPQQVMPQSLAQPVPQQAMPLPTQPLPYYPPQQPSPQPVPPAPVAVVSVGPPPMAAVPVGGAQPAMAGAPPVGAPVPMPVPSPAPAPAPAQQAGPTAAAAALAYMQQATPRV